MIGKIVLAILLLITMVVCRCIAENIDDDIDARIFNALAIFFAVILGYNMAQIIIELV